MKTVPRNNHVQMLQERGCIKIWATVFLMLVALMLHFLWSYYGQDTIEFSRANNDTLVKDWTRDFAYAIWSEGIILIGIIIFEIFYRLILYIEERKHKNTRYNGNETMLFKSVFGLSKQQCLVLLTIFTVGSAGLSMFHFCKEFRISMLHQLILQAGAAQWLAVLLNIKAPSPVDISQYNEKHNSNVSTGIAVSFFTGYLKIILPDFLNRIKDDNNKIRVRKLFVLLPFSCFLPAQVTDHNNSNSITSVTNEKQPYVEHLYKDVAGNRRRPYSNTVYKVEVPKRMTQWIITEYCTPLNTLREMSELSEFSMTHDERIAQLMLFKNHVDIFLVKDMTCKDKCKLLIYDDTLPDFSLAEYLLDMVEKDEEERRIQKSL